MIERKALVGFIVIAFAISWLLFLVPLFLGEVDAVQKQLLTQGLWALAMWGPGIAAIVATLFIAKQPFRSLRLNTLGPKRYYVWAWFLPVILAVLAGVSTVLLGIADPDLNFTMIREAMAAVPGAEAVLAGVVVAIQLAIAIVPAPFINIIFALGEELGWRGFLLPKLMPLGQWKAILISGIIWGIWHAPVIMQGHNYPGYPVAGVFMMIVFCVLVGTIFSWLYLNARSPWVAALAHGSLNAVGGLPVLFLKPGFNLALGGTLAAPAAWIGMVLFILWLIWTKRLPVQTEAGETGAG